MKAKLYLINGSLGAGKTTLLNYLLGRSELSNVRVIENEFANIGIDGSQLNLEQSRVITIAGVCICCSTGTELVDALNAFSNSSGDPVIIEATGTADSVQLINQLVVGGVLDKYVIAGNYYVLDAAEIARQSVQEEIDKRCPEMKLADTVFVTKTDLISSMQLKRLQMALWYAGITNAQLLTNGQPADEDFVLDYSDVVSKVYNIEPLDHNCVEHCPHNHGGRHKHHEHHEHHHHDELCFRAISVHDKRINSANLERLWLDKAGGLGLLRLKGDYIDTDGQQCHAEATPAQFISGYTSSLANQLVLVIIGNDEAKLKQFISFMDNL